MIYSMETPSIKLDINTSDKSVKVERQRSEKPESSQVMTRSTPRVSRKFTIGDSSWRIVPTEEVKIQYCGVFSDFRCEVRGRDKKSLLEHWKDILFNVLKIHLQAGRDIEEVCCVSSLLTELSDKILHSAKIEKYLTFETQNFLFGGSVWCLKVPIPSNKIVKVLSLPKDESIFALSFNESIAVDNKLTYAILGTGKINICHFNRAYAMSIYRQAPEMLFPEMIMNSTGGTSSIKEEETRAEQHILGDSLKDFPSDQLIVSQGLMRAK